MAVVRVLKDSAKYQRAYYWRNAEKSKTYARKYKAEHPEAEKSRWVKWHEAHLERDKEYSRKRVALAMAFIDAAHASGCVDCGNKNLNLLQSDHVRGVKVANISQMKMMPLQRIFAELDKCETRCANCHILVTAQRRKAS